MLFSLQIKLNFLDQPQTQPNKTPKCGIKVYNGFELF